jgi:SPP1 family predicted phage head-tail adaptor
VSGLTAGELDREVTIQTLSESVGGSGFPVETWTRLDDVFMARRDMRGYERFKAGQNAGASETIWTLQYREDMDPELIDVVKKRRLVANGRSYDITAASVIGRGDGIELVTLAATAVRQ